jgi:hypothetical protein
MFIYLYLSMHTEPAKTCNFEARIDEVRSNVRVADTVLCTSAPIERTPAMGNNRESHAVRCTNEEKETSLMS